MHRIVNCRFLLRLYFSGCATPARRNSCSPDSASAPSRREFSNIQLADGHFLNATHRDSLSGYFFAVLVVVIRLSTRYPRADVFFWQHRLPRKRDIAQHARQPASWKRHPSAATLTSLLATSGTASTLAVPEVRRCGDHGNSFARTDTAPNLLTPSKYHVKPLSFSMLRRVLTNGVRQQA